MILVTGSAGHIGNVFIKNLLDHGYTNVRAMLLPGEDRLPLSGLPIEFVEADITKPETLPVAFHGVTQVAHFASLVSIGDASDEVIERVNVQGALNVVKASQEAGVQRLLYVSSVHAFVPPEQGGLNEERPLMPPTAEPYERTKAAATRLMLDAAKTMDVVIGAPGGVIGPLDFKRSEMGTQFLAWTKNKTAISLPGGYDFADVRDIADGLRRVLEHGRRGEIYLLGGEFVNLSGLAKTVMTDTHGKARVMEIPLNAAYLIAGLTLKISQLQKTKAVLTPYAVKSLQAKYFVDSTKARQELGYSNRPMQQTIQDTAQWWRDHPTLGGERR